MILFTLGKQSKLELNELEKVFLQQAAEANTALRELLKCARVVERVAYATGTRTVIEFNHCSSPTKSIANVNTIFAGSFDTHIRAELRYFNGNLLYLDTMSQSEPQVADKSEQAFSDTLDVTSGPTWEGQLPVNELASLIVSFALDDEPEIASADVRAERPLRH